MPSLRQLEYLIELSRERHFRRAAQKLGVSQPTLSMQVRALEDALTEFAGCAVVISHDRWFLDRIATHILAFEGDGQVYWFEGNYELYEANRKQRLGEAADRPTRHRHKPLSR